MNEDLVVLKDLVISSDSGKVLSSANLEIKPGSVFSIFGPGGSGKSLLLKFLYGKQAENLLYSFSEFYRKPGLTYYLDRNAKGGDPAEIPSEKSDLYMIDEPENGFSLEKFDEFYAKVKEEGTTMIFVTHHLDFLEKYATEVMVLKYGECVGLYSKESFFNNEDPYIDYLSKMGC